VSDELSPAAAPGHPGPDLRASHADRDRVVEELRVAAGDGRLTAAELDDRLEAALTARTYRELAELTADLPAAAGPGGGAAPATPSDVLRFNHRGGSVRQVGPWAVPKRIEAEVVGGSVRLDFTEAAITGPALQVDAHVRGGRLVIVTRPGVVVDANDIATVGGRVVVRRAAGPQPPTILTVQISGEVRGGNVVVRPPRRTFIQWLRRQPL